MAKHAWTKSDEQHPGGPPPMYQGYKCGACGAGPIWVKFGEQVEDVAEMAHANHEMIVGSESKKASGQGGPKPPPTLRRQDEEKPVARECQTKRN